VILNIIAPPCGIYNFSGATMKKVLFSSLIALTAATNVYAQDQLDNEGFYVGGGLVSLNIPDVSEPKNYFLQAGYAFGNGFSAEAAYSDSYSDGTETAFDVDVDTSASTKAIYAAYRSTGPFYWKAKLGYLDAEFTASASGFSVSASESDTSYGVGAGYAFGAGSVELEYTTTGDKVDWDLITLGYKHQF
jgi:hypothetical protein